MIRRAKRYTASDIVLAGLSIVGLGMGLSMVVKTAAEGGLSQQDAMFIGTAGRNGKLQLHLAQLGVSRGQSQAVKGLAQRMVDDYGRINQELDALAQRHGILIAPEDPSALDRAPVGKTQGPEFDKVFASYVVGTCGENAALFEAEIAKGMDVGVKDWASTALPTLQRHLADAKMLTPPLVGQQP